jgi:methyl-accepting chemotaxis protein WspA
MKWFHNLKIRNKFLAIALTIFTFVAVLSGVSLWGIYTINQLAEEQREDQTHVYYEITTSKNIQLARNANRQAIAELSVPKIQEAIALSRKYEAEARQNWEQYLATGEEAEEAFTVKITKVKDTWAEWQKETEQVLRVALENTPEAKQKGLDLLALNWGQKTTDALQAIIDEEYEEIARRGEEAQQIFRLIVLTIICTVVAVILLTLGAVFVLARSITRPIQRLRTATQALAQGDLTQQVPVQIRDELGELSQAYNTTLYSLQGLVGQIYRQSRLIGQAANELSSQSRQQVSGSSQQASAIMETTGALQELDKAAQEITLMAHTANEAVEKSLRQAQTVSRLAAEMERTQQTGRAVVAKTLEGLHELSQQVTAFESQQQALSDQAQVIHRVIALISDVAQETHILALNAAIEAAGAGQHGDRFGIIAAEVKRLADRSLFATKEVGAALENLAQAVEVTNRQAQQSLTVAEYVTTEAGQTDDVLLALTKLSGQVSTAAQVIVREVQGTVSLTNSIGAAVRQQQVASHQMLEKMLEIEAVTTQTLSSLRDGEVATVELDQAAHRLETSANNFKLAPAA